MGEGTGVGYSTYRGTWTRGAPMSARLAHLHLVRRTAGRQRAPLPVCGDAVHAAHVAAGGHQRLAGVGAAHLGWSECETGGYGMRVKGGAQARECVEGRESGTASPAAVKVCEWVSEDGARLLYAED